MLIPIVWNQLSKIEQAKLLQRPLASQQDSLRGQVQEIINTVRAQGDAACKVMTKQFDGVSLNQLKVSEQALQEATKKINQQTRNAILRVIAQLKAFHAPQILKEFKVESSKGIFCESQPRPIQRVGLYIPGGSAPLISTLLMLAVPANIAQCKTVVMCTPPQADGEINIDILAAAAFCGIKNIYKLGGAQAIAAMAYGTETIPKVDKIFGPGNSWVTTAKMLVSLDAAGALYDLPAGPSEVMVIADRNANPEFVAADLLAQAEHGIDSQVLLLATDADLAKQVSRGLTNQLPNLSRRVIAEKALKNSYLIIVDNIAQALAIANDYAPEHLILQVDQARSYLPQIEAAGSIFLGAWSPETAGDYASGTNHVLPTYGYAKNCSGLSVKDFMKTISIQELTREGLQDISETIRVLTQIEGLDAHQQAVDIRLNSAGEK